MGKMRLVIPPEGCTTIDGIVVDGHTLVASVDGVLYYDIVDAAREAGLPDVVAAGIDELAFLLAEAGVSEIDDILINRLGGGLYRKFLEDVIQHATTSCVSADDVPEELRRELTAVYDIAYRIAVEVAAAKLTDFGL